MDFLQFFNITAGNSKARPVRKMSRSWTSTKSELKEKKVIRIEDPGAEEGGREVEKSKNHLSSSSVDPDSSINANTNSRYGIFIRIKIL